MTMEDFLEELLDILQRDDPINLEDDLADYEEWDSMSMMSLMVWFESRLAIKQPFNFFASLKTVQEIIDASEGKIA